MLPRFVFQIKIAIFRYFMVPVFVLMRTLKLNVLGRLFPTFNICIQLLELLTYSTQAQT